MQSPAEDRSGVNGHPFQPGEGDAPPREPVFNLPAIVTAFAVVLIAIHALRSFALDRETDIWTVLVFAFIPARYGELADQLPVWQAAYWSPVSYAFLHGNWTHLFVNLIWLLAFGSPLARRLGTSRFLMIVMLTAVGGAALHLVFHLGQFAPVIGASAVVSGCMGAAARFAFHGGRGGMLNVEGPALSLIDSFRNRKFLLFLVVWMVINFVFGSGAVPIAGQDAQIAWQAHIGGFVVGIFAFSFFDRRPYH